VSRSLSLVLRVCNAEKTLAENLQHLFEILNDLTEQFEVLLVDQGSVDHTVDVAQDLAVQYPQVRLARRDSADPEVDSIDRTLAETTGDIVFVQTGHAGVRPSALRQLWEMNERAAGIESVPLQARRLPGLTADGVSRPSSTEFGGLKMICRSDSVIGGEQDPF
jgi:glycosyltransferase involved in cell wall biosynthesis